MEQPAWKKSVLSGATWLRGLFMLLFAIILNVVLIWVLFILAIFQFVVVLITGKKHDKLLGFSVSLSKYFYQIALFLTFGTEEKPYPFADWPSSDTSSEVSEE